MDLASRKQVLAVACDVIKQDLQDPGDNLAPDYLPEEIKLALKASNSPSDDLSDEETWTAILAVILCFLELNESDGDGSSDLKLLRYTNAVVLLARNLVVSEKAKHHAYSAGAPALISRVFHVVIQTSITNSQEEFPALFKSILQFYVNLMINITASSSKHEQFGLTHLLNLTPTEVACIKEKNAVLTVEFATFLLSCTNKHIIPFFKPLLESTAVVDLLSEFLVGLFSQLIEGEDGVIVTNQANEVIQERMTEFAYQSVLFGIGDNVFDALCLDYIAASAYMTLLRHALKHLINQLSGNIDILARLIYKFVDFYTTQSIACFQNMANDSLYASNNSSLVADLWRAIITALELTYDFLDLQGSSAEDAFLLCESSSAHSFITQEGHHPSITTLVNLLNSAEKYLPKRNKLADQSFSENVQYSEFPYLKKTLIPILSALSNNRASVQNQVRIQGGLISILNNCMIDRNNPYIRELSIICLKCLLQGNSENQKLVSQLEAKEAVPEQTLIDAGLETEIVDGKVKVKKR